MKYHEMRVNDGKSAISAQPFPLLNFDLHMGGTFEARAKGGFVQDLGDEQHPRSTLLLCQNS